jgi:hypothetical protein
MPNPTPDPPRHPAIAIATPAKTISTEPGATCDLEGTASDPDGITAVHWSVLCGPHVESTGAATLATIAQGLKAWTATAIPLLQGLNTIVVTATNTAGATASKAAMVVRLPPPS